MGKTNCRGRPAIQGIDPRTAPPHLDGVLVDKVESEQVLPYGAPLVALHAWEELGLSDMLKREGLPPSAISTAKLMVANRLIEPLSEWALIDWAERTTLPEMLNVRITKTTKDRLYRTSDLLLKCRTSIEASLRARERQLFSLNRSVFLYDVTNSHFEGLCARIAKGQLKKPKLIERAIGRLQKKHPRVARFYSLTHQDNHLEVVRHDGKMEEALEQCGDYVLKINRPTNGPDLWRLYMTLLRAEDGFQMLKGSLGLRPNFHQLGRRVEGHIFISVLAYHLLRWVGYTLEQAEDRRDWKTIRRLLGPHSVVTTRLPLKDGRIVYIRKPSVPDPEQSQVYQKLGIDWRAAFTPVKTEVNP